MRNNENKYDVRAPPRRRLKGNDFDEQPVFLRKAYAMISSCPAEIGGWSESGDTVVIKDSKAFSERIIPTAYKHNNFSSFVRQLNFYGFRKVKSNVMQHSADWWEFRHPCFIRGQPQLLSEIKRSVHFEGGGEVGDLKSQVTDLTDKVGKLEELLEELTGKMDGLTVIEEPRRKVSRPIGREDSGREQETRPSSLPSIALPEAVASPKDTFFSLDGLQMEGMEEVWDDLMELDALSPIPPIKVKLEPGTVPQPSTAIPSVFPSAVVPSASLASDLQTVLTSLTPELKLRFVDKLAEVMGQQLAQGAAAAAAAGGGAAAGGAVGDKLDLPDIAMPLASAALGAFVMASLQSLHGPGMVAGQKVPAVCA